MNLDVKVIGKKISGLGKRVLKYSAFIAVLLVLAAYTFVVYRIRTLATHEPSDEAVSEQLKTLKRPKVDQSTIDKIQQLQDTNVQVKALFDQARDNPFQN